MKEMQTIFPNAIYFFSLCNLLKYLIISIMENNLCLLRIYEFTQQERFRSAANARIRTNWGKILNRLVTQVGNTDGYLTFP